MPQVARQPDAVNFDAYELRLSTREFLKHGLRIKLPPQAFQVLQMLVERPGQLISREEFHRALWPADTFVDFDQGLNSAVKKIRDALNDSAETPRYIETLPRLGYRFVGEVNGRDSTDVLGPVDGNHASEEVFTKPNAGRTTGSATKLTTSHRQLGGRNSGPCRIGNLPSQPSRACDKFKYSLDRSAAARESLR